MVNLVIYFIACGGPKIPEPPALPQAQPQQRLENLTAELMIIELAVLNQKPWSEIDKRFTKLNRGCNPELHTYWGLTAEQYERTELAIIHYNQAIRCHGLKEEDNRILLQKRIDTISFQK
ncbi:MAG: hypothetical protein CMK59_14975 [Proteobacteria bacterium]|nr:hypothetical protein [Pseudomonadota bacterium]